QSSASASFFATPWPLASSSASLCCEITSPRSAARRYHNPASVSSFLMPLPFSSRYAKVCCARSQPLAAASRSNTIASASLREVPRPISSMRDNRNFASISLIAARRYQVTASAGFSGTPAPLSYITPSSRWATGLPPSASLVQAGAAAVQLAADASLAQPGLDIPTSGGARAADAGVRDLVVGDGFTGVRGFADLPVAGGGASGTLVAAGGG